MKRTTIRFNDLEELELEKIKKTFGINDDSKAIKLSIEWVNNHLAFVTKSFIPPSYDMVLYKRTKNFSKGTRIKEENYNNMSL